MIPPISMHVSRPGRWSRRCRPLRAHAFLVVVVVLAFLALGRPGILAAAPTPPTKRVLLLYSDDRLLPASVALDATIRETFAASRSNRLEFYSEFLDVARFSLAQQQRQRDFLREKYAGRAPDLIIAVASSALNFLLEPGGNLFTNVPTVFCAIAPSLVPKALPERAVGLSHLRDLGRTLELALAVQPEVRRAVVVVGNGRFGQAEAEEFRRQQPAFEPRLSIAWLTNRTMAELRAELAQLPDQTVVLYTALFEDAAGQLFTPREALAELAAASRAPIYGFSSTHFGHGLAGGVMVPYEEVGRKAARLGLRILAGAAPKDLWHAEKHEAVPMFDWRELQRWGIDEHRLPPGSVVLFRPPSFWERHKLVIITGLIITVAQALTIDFLLIQARRRKKAQRELKESEERMTLAAEAAHVGVWIHTLARGEIWATDEWRSLFGFTKSEPLDFERCLQRLHPEDREAMRLVRAKAIEGGGHYDTEYRVVLPSGQMRWISSRGRVEFNGDGQAVLVRGVSIDITTRKRAEEERREANQAAREVSGKLITAQEDERKRLARDLHDDLNQRLAMLSVDMELLGQLPEDNRALSQQRIGEISGRVKEMSSEVHRLSYQLHPAKLDQLGLVSAARSFCRELSRQSGVPVELVHDDLPRDLHTDLALCFYRVIQEALQNMVKHSRARTARVELRKGDKELRMTVSDDGQGFDVDRAMRDGGLGLVGMRERIRLVRGQIVVQSAPGQGTRIELSAPLRLKAGDLER